MNDKIYLVTDGCMWEKNKRESASHAHAMEVVDLETGAVQYIRSGSHVTFVKGSITDTRTQEVYNKATEKKEEKVLHRNGKSNELRRKRKEKSSSHHIS